MPEKQFVGRVSDKSFVYNGQQISYNQLSFTLDDLNKMSQHVNAQGYVNVDFKLSAKGNRYMEINTWKKEG